MSLCHQHSMRAGHMVSVAAFWVRFLLLCSLQPWLRCEDHAGEVLHQRCTQLLQDVPRAAPKPSKTGQERKGKAGRCTGGTPSSKPGSVVKSPAVPAERRTVEANSIQFSPIFLLKLLCQPLTFP